MRAEPGILRRIAHSDLAPEADKIFELYRAETGKQLVQRRRGLHMNLHITSSLVFSVLALCFVVCFDIQLPARPGGKKQESEQIVMQSPDRWPTLEEASRFLEGQVEGIELGVSNYTIKQEGASLEMEADWKTATAGILDLNLSVEIEKPLPLSSVSEPEGLKMLTNTNRQTPVETWDLPSATLTTQAAAGAGNIDPALTSELDVLKHLGRELAVRCRTATPQLRRGEQSKRSLIGPSIFSAAMITGKLDVIEEFSTTDRFATGSVDIVAQLESFSVVVVEGKDKDLLDRNFGQLYASMASVRNQFMDNHMQPPDAEDTSGSRKRKRLSFDIAQKSQLLRKVPSLGILTNGRDWKVAKYDHEKGRLFESKTISSHLLQGSKASEAQAVIKPILQHLVAILREQIAAFEAFKEQHAQWLVDQGDGIP